MLPILMLASLLGAEPVAPNDADPIIRGRVADARPEVSSKEIDVEVLAKFIKSRKAAPQGCYEKELRKNPTLAGKIVIRFTITKLGRSSLIETEENTMPTDELASCVKAIIRGWVFPFKPTADALVKYPFVFAPAP